MSTRRPKIAFDHRIFAFQRHGGVSRYIVGLCEHLPALGIDAKIIAPLHVNAYLQDLPKRSVWGRHAQASPKAVRSAVIAGEALARPLAWAYGADIVHETYHHFRRVAPAKAKVVTTIYDLIFELFPPAGAEHHLRKNIKAAVARADKLICISKSTERDLLRFYPEAEGRTEVVLIGFDPGTSASDSAAPHSKPYLLFVGARLQYKNFGGLLAAFGQSKLLREAFDIICVGGGAFTTEEVQLLTKWKLHGKVHQREADDKALQGWYRHAQLFVYPSLYEGFGIPPLEAMAANCPVVCMNASSVPEVCGDAAEYAYPGEPDSLRTAIEKVAFSAERAESLRRAGLERLKLFSWRECARQTGEIYRGLL
jgi:glycosyltransferase involved in cell wall biosynthesis